MIDVFGAAIDVALLLLLCVLLWRLRKDPTRAWLERERRLREISESLRSMVAQAEGAARDLDRALAERMSRISVLLESAPSARRDAAADRPVPEDEGRSGRLERLLAEGRDPREVARELGIPLAEARLAAQVGQWREVGLRRGGGPG